MITSFDGYDNEDKPLTVRCGFHGVQKYVDPDTHGGASCAKCACEPSPAPQPSEDVQELVRAARKVVARFDAPPCISERGGKACCKHRAEIALCAALAKFPEVK